MDEGMVAKMSPTFPHTSIDLGFRAVALPADGIIPYMTDWKWIHTPGHTEGHVSLFRERDRVLLPADAFTTVKQESLISVLTQNEQISGPPKYLTVDWNAAENSVKRLRGLNPSLAIPSHGQPMKGKELASHLELLENHFDEIAIPEEGHFSPNSCLTADLHIFISFTFLHSTRVFAPKTKVLLEEEEKAVFRELVV